MKALATSFNALIELGDLYEFYKLFISQSTFQRPISAFLFKNNSTKILVMLAVSTSFTQVPEKQLIRIPEQCAVVYVFK